MTLGLSPLLSPLNLLQTHPSPRLLTWKSQKGWNGTCSKPMRVYNDVIKWLANAAAESSELESSWRQPQAASKKLLALATDLLQTSVREQRSNSMHCWACRCMQRDPGSKQNGSFHRIVNASGPFLWLSGEFCIATVHSQQMGHHLPRKPRTSLIWHPRGETLLKGKTIVRDSITVSVRWKYIQMKPELCCTQWGTNTMGNKQKQDITKAKLYSVEIW